MGSGLGLAVMALPWLASAQVGFSCENPIVVEVNTTYAYDLNCGNASAVATFLPCGDKVYQPIYWFTWTVPAELDGAAVDLTTFSEITNLDTTVGIWLDSCPNEDQAPDNCNDDLVGLGPCPSLSCSGLRLDAIAAGQVYYIAVSDPIVFHQPSDGLFTFAIMPHNADDSPNFAPEPPGFIQTCTSGLSCPARAGVTCLSLPCDCVDGCAGVECRQQCLNASPACQFYVRALCREGDPCGVFEACNLSCVPVPYTEVSSSSEPASSSSVSGSDLLLPLLLAALMLLLIVTGLLILICVRRRSKKKAQKIIDEVRAEEAAEVISFTPPAKGNKDRAQAMPSVRMVRQRIETVRAESFGDDDGLSNELPTPAGTVELDSSLSTVSSWSSSSELAASESEGGATLGENQAVRPLA